MKKRSFILSILLIIFLFITSCISNKEAISPNGHVKLLFSLDDEGKPYYEVHSRKSVLITPSAMGLIGTDNLNLNKGFSIEQISFDSKDEQWTQPWGENKTMREHYNEMAVNLKNEEGTELTIRFRLFDDGLGFRYEYNISGVDSVYVMDEQTEFNIVEDGDSWSIRANGDTYELLYAEQPISKIEDANTPMTFKTKSGVYASIHEAALYDFPEMTLKNEGNTKFKAQLTPWPDGVKAKKTNTFTTSWRTIQIGNKAVDLINSGLILNLNEPSVLETTDWIEPMKYVGIWWGMHLGIETWKMDERHGATTAKTKKYIDFAQKNDIRGVLVEGWNEGWEGWGTMQHFDFTKPYADFDIKELVKYAKDRGVVIIGHHETGGNVPNYERQLDNAFKWYKDLGIDNVKTGYAGGFPDGLLHHGQYGVNHYQKVVEVAAKYKMTINAHEPIKDTGIRRTWPNMMSREGARGMEWNAWSEGNPPAHYEILPFTRLLSGPMDYTPGTFDILFEKTKDLPTREKWNDQDKGNSRVNTTLAKQLANWVIIYSPVQMASDLIEHYEGHPAFQFFRDFDADCDKSIALDGEPGQFVVIMRQAKDKFFIGASTNEEARTVNVKLDFLDAGKSYRAAIYADGDNADWKTNPTDYKIIEKVVTAADALDIVMAKGGGQAISFIEEK